MEHLYSTLLEALYESLQLCYISRIMLTNIDMVLLLLQWAKLSWVTSVWPTHAHTGKSNNGFPSTADGWRHVESPWIWLLCIRLCINTDTTTSLLKSSYSKRYVGCLVTIDEYQDMWIIPLILINLCLVPFLTLPFKTVFYFTRDSWPHGISMVQVSTCRFKLIMRRLQRNLIASRYTSRFVNP